MKVIFGIDVGGTSIKIGLFDENKKLILKDSIPTNKKDNGKYLLREIVQEIKKIMKSKNLKQDDLLGVGFGIPGPVINNFVVRCPNLGWENVELEKEFLKELGFKTQVKATNDATVAAYGEYSILEDKKDMAFLTLGTGVGGGLVVNGKLVEGTHGSAGEFGHLQVEYDNPRKCTCGLYGCLETTASIRGIGWVAKDVLKSTNKKTKLKESNLSSRIIFDLAKKGDPVAIEVKDKVADYIAKGAAKIAVSVDPEIILIGGGISNAGPILTEAISKAYQKYTYFGTKAVLFDLAKLGNDAGIYGASELIYRNI